MGIIRVDEQLIDPGYVGPPTDFRNNGIILTHFGLLNRFSPENTSDNAFVDEILIQLQFALRI